jgi:hypothetical protein
MQVFTRSGKPKRHKDGNLVYQSATKWTACRMITHVIGVAKFLCSFEPFLYR